MQHEIFINIQDTIFLILVEDVLAKYILENIIDEKCLV